MNPTEPRKRPSPEVARWLLEHDGETMTFTDHNVVEDVDGAPLAVTSEPMTGTLYVTPELLGYTIEELYPDETEIP